MKIQIENYFGNDILTLNYHEKNVNISKLTQIDVEVIAGNCGFDTADVDVDENGHDYLRLQEFNVDNTEKEGKDNLIKLVNQLNKHFL